MSYKYTHSNGIAMRLQWTTLTKVVLIIMAGGRSVIVTVLMIEGLFTYYWPLIVGWFTPLIQSAENQPKSIRATAYNIVVSSV